MVLRIGTVLGNRYEIIGKIGSGGMSDVYKAVDNKLARNVAIKVLKDEFANDQNFVSKFKMEAQSAACLSHPNIVNVYDVNVENGIYYIVMELIEGITLKKYIERLKKLGIRESIEVAMQVARGLEAAHAEHIIHRDIKPQNIMISKEGKVKVTDFGIARAASAQTISSNTMGSVHYISPEQARGGICDERSDIYSLGITMYEMLTGRLPFEGDSTVAIALQHIQGEMVPPSQYEPLIPVSMEKIILKCTQKKPEQRYQSAEELIVDLKKALTSPNEDFVKITPPELAENMRETSSIKKDEINQEVERVEQERRAEALYQMGVEDEEDSEVQTAPEKRPSADDDDDDEDDDDVDTSRFEKIVTYIGIGIAVIIVLIACFIGLRACGIFNPDTDPGSASTTADNTKVPMIKVLGMTYEEANSALSAIGLHIKASYDTNDEYPEGEIFFQDINEGQVIDRDSTINVRISTGESAKTIPAGLEGLTPEDASARLKEAGFVNISATYYKEYSDTIEEGHVVRTDPASGSQIPSDATIVLVVSSGRQIVYVTVPSLVGMKETDARTKITSDKLNVGKVEEQYSETVGKGKVISQWPSSDESVEEGSTVNLVVSKGSEYVEVPDLRGDTLQEAKAKLEAAGLRLGEVTSEYSDDSFKDKVLAQSPVPGGKLKKAESVSILIGLGPEPTTAPPPTEPPTAAPTETAAPEPEGEGQPEGGGE